MNKLIPLLVFSILLLVPVGAQNAFAGAIGFGDCSTDLEGANLTLNPGESDTFEVSCTIIPVLFVPIGIDLVSASSDCQDKGIGFTNLSGIIVNSGSGDTSTFEISVTNISVAPGEEEHCIMSIAAVDATFGPTFFTLDPEIWFFVQEDSVVGGELLPIDSTALLLAGAQSFSWMIPAVLSVIGIGLVLVRKK